jgi:hypothetical protein
LISSNLVVDTIGLMFAYVPSGKVPAGASTFTDTLLYLSAFVIGSTLSFSHAVASSRADHVSITISHVNSSSSHVKISHEKSSIFHVKLCFSIILSPHSGELDEDVSSSSQ